MTFELLKTKIEKSFKETFKSQALGANLILLEEVNSTNLYALQNSEVFPEGSVIISLAQTAGRGRKGRSWHSPAGTGLYMSILLKKMSAIGDSNTLNLLASLSVNDALNKELKSKDESVKKLLELKWPNDILYDSRKIAGILSERKSGVKTTSPTVVGIGVNINHTPTDFPQEIAENSISLYMIDSKKRDYCEIAMNIISHINVRYDELKRQGSDYIIKTWMQNSPSCKGTRVRIFTDNEEFSAVTEGLDQRGFLKVRRYGDRLQTLLSADIVSLRRL
jgi:BirA family biotin operon repressor/biotin-[acetyl-CoA-carboxylase] ligase